jgi:hypothetical protein
VPVVAMHGEKSEPRLKSAVQALAKAVPRAQQHVLKGQTHNVNPVVLTEALVQLFAA